jgi:TatD DNase family protein
MLVDTHAHLTMAELAGDIPGVLQRAATAGVSAAICVGIDLESSRQAVDLAQQHSQLFAAVGIHPNDCSSLSPEWLQQLRTLAGRPRVVAIGEIGLDYYRDRTSREQQQAVFRDQLELAGELGLPVVIHCRAADDDLAGILQQWSGSLPSHQRRGVLHCFSGDRELMDAGTEAGFYLSFAGPITYHNAKEAVAMAAAAPLDRLLVETDSPYLAPHPYRGKRNEPAFVRLVAEQLAKIRGETVERTVEITGRNAATLFGLDLSPAPLKRD